MFSSVRFILSLLVLFTYMPTPYMFLFQIGGDAVVTLFFISGYIVPLAYEKYYLTAENDHSSTRFYINRTLKIFPIYWIAVAITFFDYKL
jgi:peptidoglycan/LPS O-acetylase OafA/YrhL